MNNEQLEHEAGEVAPEIKCTCGHADDEHNNGACIRCSCESFEEATPDEEEDHE